MNSCNLSIAILMFSGSFENKEQIEVSKFYEKLPKPHAVAIQEWLDDKVYHRDSKEEIEE